MDGIIQQVMFSVNRHPNVFPNLEITILDISLDMCPNRASHGMDYSQSLEEGIRMTYDWISEQIRRGELVA